MSCPVSIQAILLISYCSLVQGRMAGASTSGNEFESVVKGQHIYKSAWTPLTDKIHKACCRKTMNVINTL